MEQDMWKDESVAYLNSSFKKEIGFEAVSVIGELKESAHQKKTILVVCSQQLKTNLCLIAKWEVEGRGTFSVKMKFQSNATF